MTDQEILAQYVNLAEFISQCFSNDVEVLVHDAAHPDSSVIAIFNGHVSGREVGAPMPPLGRRFMFDDMYKNMNAMVKYKGVTGKGVVVRSSTYFIRNDEGNYIGAMCVNVDMRKYEALKQLVGTMFENPAIETHPEVEHLSTTVGWQLNNVISDFYTRKGRLPDTLTREDRMEILRELVRLDFFERKGAISEVAERLDISEPSIYRYLKTIKRNGK